MPAPVPRFLPPDAYVTQPPSPMSAEARRIWARHANDAGTADAVAEAAHSLFAQLGEGLSRWVGKAGYAALLHRALALQPAHCSDVITVTTEAGSDKALSVSVRARDAGESADAAVALLATLMGLLARVVGEPVANHLLERVVLARPRPQRSAPNYETQRKRDA